MNTTQTILAIIGGLVTLALVAGGLWGIIQVSGKDAMMKRMQSDNAYLRSQLDFIEPRFKDSEAKNEMLMKLHNPTAKLDEMSALERANHEETVRLLTEQKQDLRQIHEKLEQTRG